MARRRPLTDGDSGDAPAPFDDEFNVGGGGAQGFATDEFGNVLPDFSNNPNYPTPFVDYIPEEIAGSPEGPRDIFLRPGHSVQPRVTQPPPAPPSGNIDRIVAALPQGVEAAGAGATNAPMQDASPQSVSLRATPPASASGGPPPTSMPRRQPTSTPMQFGSSQGASLVGRGEGQFGGGIGLPGGSGGKGPRPTEQMLALLRELGIGEV